MTSSSSSSSSASVSLHNLECPFCFDIFHNPSSLICGHTYCHQCLEKMAKTENKVKSVDCPECKKKHVCDASGFAVNIRLRDTIADMKKIQITDNHGPNKGGQCMQFDECNGKSKMYCPKCEGYICEKCSEAHCSSGFTRSHILIDTAKKAVYPVCPAHREQGEKVTMYCQSCEKLVCNICINLSHRNEALHSITTVSEAAQKKRIAIVESSHGFHAYFGKELAKEEAELQRLQDEIAKLKAAAAVGKKKILTIKAQQNGVLAQVDALKRISNEPTDFDILDQKKFVQLANVLKQQFQIDVARKGGEKMFTYVSDFDENGILYYLGTKGKTQPYKNPCLDKRVAVATSSGQAKGAVEVAFSRDPNGNCYTTNSANSWFQLELKKNTVLPTHYSIRHSINNAGSHMLRNWKLQGSKDGRTWVHLVTHANNLLNPNSRTASWPIPAVAGKKNKGKGFRFFRVYQTGLNASRNNHLMMGSFEIYGRLY